MSVEDKQFMLVQVQNGIGAIGVCAVNRRMARPGDRTLKNEFFYLAEEPLISITTQSVSDPYANKLIAQISSIDKADETIYERCQAATDAYFGMKQNALKALQPILELLNDGLYVVHESKMLQSDGAGNFFWNAYVVRHEVSGSSKYSQVIGPENNYVPCFLIPTVSISDYAESRMRLKADRVKKGKAVGGIAYHISGMFSALLDGHHSATACLLNDADFTCLVIEPVNDVLYENEEIASEERRSPKIIALSCPFVKIPLDSVPETMLEGFLMSRKNHRPLGYAAIREKSVKTLKLMSKKILPKDVYTKTELLPDCAMIESAHAVTGLSEEQLNALLAGETKYNDRTIISNNYYSSVVTACNYLQYANFEKFIDFATTILYNPDLTAVHKYIAERLQSIMNSRVYDFFKGVVDNEYPLYQDILQLAVKYCKQYKEFSDRKVQEDFEESIINEKRTQEELAKTAAKEFPALDLARTAAAMKPKN